VSRAHGEERHGTLIPSAPHDADDTGAWAALSSPDVFPHDPNAGAGVEWIQTHISHVYRTRDRVYKFRKAVDLASCGSRHARNATQTACAR
jgi:aminoglycoside phosphotransferase family enzyme